MNNDERAPDYLVIGHLTRDLADGGAVVGGTCGYAGIAAARLGRNVAAVTSHGPDMPPCPALDEIEIKRIPAEQSTSFKNMYAPSGRTQKWPSTASPISVSDVPEAWRGAPVVHLAPVAQEMSPGMIGEFEDCLVCVTLQGWLRAKDEDGNVIYGPHPDLEKRLSSADVAVMSLEDVFGRQEDLVRYMDMVRLGVETLGSRGCLVYQDGRVTHVPVEPVVEADPTGAGDVFAAAFFIEYHRTRNALSSACFANAGASLSVEKAGVDCAPQLGEVWSRILDIYGAPTAEPKD